MGAGGHGTLCTFLSIFYEPKAALKIVFMKKEEKCRGREKYSVNNKSAKYLRTRNTSGDPQKTQITLLVVDRKVVTSKSTK